MKTFRYHTTSRRILGDLYTPVSTYLKVRDLYPQSALMESSDYHSHDNSRSFIALNPIASISFNHGEATSKFPDGTRQIQSIDKHNDSPDHILSDFLKTIHIDGEQKNYCGLYGYTSFNAIRYFEPVNIKDCRQEKDDAPDLLYILYKYVMVFDHF